MRTAPVHLILVALLVASGLVLPGAAQDSQRPIWDAGWELAGVEYPDGSTVEPAEIEFAPRNATFDARLRFRAREDIDDTLDLRLDAGVLNRTAIPVEVSAGEAFSTTVEASRIQPDGGRDPRLVAAFRNTTWQGDEIEVEDRVLLIPQPRARLVNPPNIVGEHDRIGGSRRGGVEAGGASLSADWDETVTVRAHLENPWNVPTGPLPLRLVARNDVVARGQVASLAPGENRTVDVAEVNREDFDRRSLVGDARRGPLITRLELAVAWVGDDAWQPLRNYTFPARDIGDQARARGGVAFHAGLHVGLPDQNLTLGERSRLAVELRNRGGTPERPVPVDLRVGPVPDLAYGPDVAATRSLTVELAPGENRTVTIPFTPRVGVPHEVSAHLELPRGDRKQGVDLPVESPVDVRIQEDHRRTVEVGETAEATLVVEAPADVGGRLDVVATARAASFGVGGRARGTPFSSLLTTGDLVSSSFEPARLEAGDGGGTVNRSVTVELTPQAAGRLAVVPIVRSGDLVYAGIDRPNAVDDLFDRTPVVRDPEEGDERVRDQGQPPPAVLELKALPSGAPGPAVVAPPALVLLGVAGVEVRRRWFVR